MLLYRPRRRELTSLMCICACWIFYTHYRNQAKTFRPTRYHAAEKQHDFQTPNTTKVMLFCYMRGGSSFFGRFFAKHQDVTYFYEPYAKFYRYSYGTAKNIYPQNLFWDRDKRRYSTAEELSLLTQFNHNILSCNFSQEPVLYGMVTCHPPAKYNRCYAHIGKYLRYINSFFARTLEDQHYTDLRKSVEETLVTRQVYDASSNHTDWVKFGACSVEVTFQECLEDMLTKCQGTSFRAEKVLRLSMRDVKTMLDKDPDMKVVYLYRDPRSIVSSRLHFPYPWLHPLARSNITLEAKFLCGKLKEDFNHFQELKMLYPKNMIKVKYEDFVQSTRAQLQGIYKFIGLSITPDIEVLIRESELNREIYTDKWKTTFSHDNQKIINHLCKDILQELNYVI